MLQASLDIANFLFIQESNCLFRFYLYVQVSAAVTEGVIAAHTKSSQYMKEKMGNLTKGMLNALSM